MTEEQWKQVAVWQAEAKAKDEVIFEQWLHETGRWKEGVDEEAIRANLRLTMNERFDKVQKEVNEYWAWRRVQEAMPLQE